MYIYFACTISVAVRWHVVKFSRGVWCQVVFFFCVLKRVVKPGWRFVYVLKINFFLLVLP